MMTSLCTPSLSDQSTTNWYSFHPSRLRICCYQIIHVDIKMLQEKLKNVLMEVVESEQTYVKRLNLFCNVRQYFIHQNSLLFLYLPIHTHTHTTLFTTNHPSTSTQTFKGKVAMLNSMKYTIHWEDMDILFDHLSQVHKLHKDQVLPSFKLCLTSFQHQSVTPY